jgi:hypothetical protein
MLPLLLMLSLTSSPRQRQVAQRLYDKASAADGASDYERALHDFAAVCSGVTIFGTVRAVNYLGLSNTQRLHANEPNDNDWANAAIVLGIATVGGAVGTGFAW